MSSLNFMPLEVNFKPSGKYWVASCPALGVVTQGETFEKAQKNLEEAIVIFIESCLKRGTLKQVLAESGCKKTEIKGLVKSAIEHFVPAQNLVNGQLCHA